jgi:acyl CoA:acetate/3-ketoacid CoA transferase alpha subunit
LGNLTDRDGARNFNPIMAMAPRTTTVQTAHVVEFGAIWEHFNSPAG